MNMSAIRRTFLLSAFSLVLGTGLVTQAVAGEQLDTIKKNGTLNVGLEALTRHSASSAQTAS
jgi:cystine transport system substrate-binding protein